MSVLSCGRLARLALSGDGARSNRPLLGDDDPLGQVAQHRVGRALERPPRAGAAGALGLLPDDLAPQQQPEAVLQDAR